VLNKSLAAAALTAGVLVAACVPPHQDPPAGSTTTSATTSPTTAGTTTSTSSTLPPPEPCPPAPATQTAGPDSLTEDPISSWGVGGVPNGGGFTATVLGDVVYVGGLFSQAVPPSGAAVARSNIAAFCLADGQLLDAFVANTNGQVWALTNDGANVFAAGDFTSLNGQPVTRLVKLDPLTGENVTAFAPPDIPKVVRALDYSSVTGQVYAGGDFRILGVAAGNRMKGASFDHNTGAYAGWNPQADAIIESLKVSADGQSVFIGGNFKNLGPSTNPQAHDNFARTAASNGNPSSIVYGANQGVPGAIGAHVLGVDVDTDHVSPYASTGLVSPAGSMTGGGNKALGLNADGTERWRRGFNGDAQAIVMIGDNVYVGFHDGFQNDPTKRIVGLTKANGTVTAFQPTANGHPLGVRGLAAGAGRLIAVGDFTTMGTRTQLHGLAIFP
jgi:hypothetical protein